MSHLFNNPEHRRANQSIVSVSECSGRGSILVGVRVLTTTLGTQVIHRAEIVVAKQRARLLPHGEHPFSPGRLQMLVDELLSPDAEMFGDAVDVILIQRDGGRPATIRTSGAIDDLKRLLVQL